MLNTVLFDMGGTLEDIWYNDETTADVMEKLKAAGKVKSATYGQLMGNKLMYQSMLSMYRDHGLIE